MYLYLSGSEFLVTFTNSNKQLSNVKSEFFNYGFSMLEIYRCITFLGIEIVFINQCLSKFMSANIYWSIEVGSKFLSDLVIFWMFSGDTPLDFHESIRVVPLKYLMCF